jgi:microcystin degradation protein MlrC
VSPDRVGIVAFHHESNTFSRMPTPLDDFTIAIGDDVVRFWGRSHNEVAGFLRGIDDEGMEAVPLLVATLPPAGPSRPTRSLTSSGPSKTHSAATPSWTGCCSRPTAPG